MRRRERLSDLQCNVGRYLLARMDDDGACMFDGEDLCAQVGNEYPYNIFRQFIVKGLIDELPAKRSDGMWELHIPDPARFRKAIGAGRVIKPTPSRKGADNHDPYCPGCALLRPPLAVAPAPCDLNDCPPVSGVSSPFGLGCIELALESAIAAMDAEILRIVLADDFTDEDEEALKNLICARKSAGCADAATMPAYVLAVSPPVKATAPNRPHRRYGFI